MSKRDKEFQRLLHQKTLTSDEMIRLLELDGWVPDPDKPQTGSHKHFVHPVKKGKVSVPDHHKVLKPKTHARILQAAGLKRG